MSQIIAPILAISLAANFFLFAPLLECYIWCDAALGKHSTPLVGSTWLDVRSRGANPPHPPTGIDPDLPVRVLSVFRIYLTRFVGLNELAWRWSLRFIMLDFRVKISNPSSFDNWDESVPFFSTTPAYCCSLQSPSSASLPHHVV